MGDKWQKPIQLQKLLLMPSGENQAIIQPQKGKREEALPSLAILTFTPQDIDLFLHHSPSLHKRSQRVYLSEVFAGSHQGVPLVLVGPMLGAPQTILVLEKLIALGVTQVICMGWCGSLQAHVGIGDLVLPTGAFCEEGTSAHYPIEDPQPGPSRELLVPLKQALAEKAVAVHEGMVWSTDAPFRETVEKVINYRGTGVLAVDMETSALFTVAAFREIRIIAALVVSDDLSALKWVHGFKEPRFGFARETLVESVLGVVSSATQGKLVS
jgi:uridine phosphorylase